MSISTLIQKRDRIMDTFVPNNGFDKAFEIINNELKKDVVNEKMRSVRSTYLYEKGAREYYNRYGTSGEF
jgi:hypothetical protein